MSHDHARCAALTVLWLKSDCYKPKSSHLFLKYDLIRSNTAISPSLVVFDCCNSKGQKYGHCKHNTETHTYTHANRHHSYQGTLLEEYKIWYENYHQKYTCDGHPSTYQISEVFSHITNNSSSSFITGILDNFFVCPDSCL